MSLPGQRQSFGVPPAPKIGSLNLTSLPCMCPGSHPAVSAHPAHPSLYRAQAEVALGQPEPLLVHLPGKGSSLSSFSLSSHATFLPQAPILPIARLGFLFLRGTDYHLI